MKTLSPEFVKKINSQVAITRNSPTLTQSLDSVDKLLSELEQKDRIGIPLYKSVEEKASKMLLEFQNSQPFIDFNEETGILSAIYLLRFNGRIVNYGPEDIQFLYRGMRAHALDFEDMVNWCEEHSKVPTARPRMK